MSYCVFGKHYVCMCVFLAWEVNLIFLTIR